MEGWKHLKAELKPTDYVFSIVLRKGYYQITLHPDALKFFGVRWNHREYVYACLPFGMSLSPRAFTRLVTAVVDLLRDEINPATGKPAVRAVVFGRPSLHL